MSACTSSPLEAANRIYSKNEYVLPAQTAGQLVHSTANDDDRTQLVQHLDFHHSFNVPVPYPKIVNSLALLHLNLSHHMTVPEQAALKKKPKQPTPTSRECTPPID